MQAPAEAAPTLAAGIEAVRRDTPRSRYLVSAGYDLGYIILAPVLALLLTIVLAQAPATLAPETLFGTDKPWAAFFIAMWTNAHLIAVVFRSHANADIFRRFRVRFTWVPLALFAAFLTSDWLLTSGVVLAVLWDIYHSSMQTFGFCRIYDAKAGNPPLRGRMLDMLLNHVLYIGPILVGRNLAPNIAVIQSYDNLGWHGPSQLFQWIGQMQQRHAGLVLQICVAYIVFYIAAYAWLVRTRGHRISRPKLWLLVSTGIISTLAWGFLPQFQAFFVANFFHALQYFAIVWATEKTSLQRLLQCIGPARAPLALVFALYSAFVLAVGIAHTVFDVPEMHLGYALFTVVSLMHFWYDGFIWSVRRAEVHAAH